MTETKKITAVRGGVEKVFFYPESATERLKKSGFEIVSVEEMTELEAAALVPKKKTDGSVIIKVEIEERIVEQIADSVVEKLKSAGVKVVSEDALKEAIDDTLEETEADGEISVSEAKKGRTGKGV